MTFSSTVEIKIIDRKVALDISVKGRVFAANSDYICSDGVLLHREQTTLFFLYIWGFLLKCVRTSLKTFICTSVLLASWFFPSYVLSFPFTHFSHVLGCIILEVKRFRARNSSSYRAYHESRIHFSKLFEKLENFLQFFQKWGGAISHPPLGYPNPLTTFLWARGYVLESLVTLAITGTECIKNKQTNKQTNILLYILEDGSTIQALRWHSPQ